MIEIKNKETSETKKFVMYLSLKQISIAQLECNLSSFIWRSIIL